MHVHFAGGREVGLADVVERPFDHPIGRRDVERVRPPAAPGRAHLRVVSAVAIDAGHRRGVHHQVERVEGASRTHVQHLVERIERTVLHPLECDRADHRQLALAHVVHDRHLVRVGTLAHRDALHARVEVAVVQVDRADRGGVGGQEIGTEGSAVGPRPDRWRPGAQRAAQLAAGNMADSAEDDRGEDLAGLSSRGVCSMADSSRGVGYGGSAPGSRES